MTSTASDGFCAFRARYSMQARGALRIEKNRQGQVGGGFRRGDRIERETGRGGQRFARAFQPGWAGRKQLQQRFGQGEKFRRQGLEHGGESLALLAGCDDAGIHLTVAAQLVAVVEAADFLGCGFRLITVQ
jgi:hypothetical protein